MLATREEIVIVDGVAVRNKTAVMATNEGLVAIEVTSLQTQNPQPRPPIQAIRAAPVVVVPVAPEHTCCCGCCAYDCCDCDDDYPWYSLRGKGWGLVLLLLLMYLVFFAIIAFLAIAWAALACLGLFCNDD